MAKSSKKPENPDKPATASPAQGETKKGERIAKVLARLGVASRRDVEKLIAAGNVAVDGKVLDHPAFIVEPHHRITVNGRPVAAKEPTRLWRFYKPQGVITSARDPQGRPTFFDLLPKNLPRVVSVGRLDLNSEGLLLLTNDGSFARFLELPQQRILRRYRVRVHVGARGVDEEKLKKLSRGITIDGFRYAGIEAEIDQRSGHNAWLNVTLTEGKNREIRKVMEYLGWPVSRLIRIGFGPFQLGKMEKGEVEEIPARVLADQFESYFKES